MTDVDLLFGDCALGGFDDIAEGEYKAVLTKSGVRKGDDGRAKSVFLELKILTNDEVEALVGTHTNWYNADMNGLKRLRQDLAKVGLDFTNKDVQRALADNGIANAAWIGKVVHRTFKDKNGLEAKRASVYLNNPICEAVLTADALPF